MQVRGSDWRWRPRRIGEAFAGLALMIAGCLALFALGVMSYATSGWFGDIFLRLGLAETALGAMLAQGAVLFGAWLLWRSGQDPKA